MNKQTLQLKGFPPALLSTKWEEVQLQSPMGFNKVARMLYEDTPVIYVYRDFGTTIDRILEDEKYYTKDMLALDFAEYERKALDKDESNGVPQANLLYIYGVGEEISSTSFPDKLLATLVKTNIRHGGAVVIASDIVMPGEFTKRYPMANAAVQHKLHVVR